MRRYVTLDASGRVGDNGDTPIIISNHITLYIATVATKILCSADAANIPLCILRKMKSVVSGTVGDIGDTNVVTST